MKKIQYILHERFFSDPCADPAADLGAGHTAGCEADSGAGCREARGERPSLPPQLSETVVGADRGKAREERLQKLLAGYLQSLKERVWQCETEE